MALQLGMNAYLAYNTSGTTGGSWVTIGNVKDLTLSLESAEADVTTRSNTGWRATVATLRDASIEFEMIWDTDDTAFAELVDAYTTNTTIALRCWDKESQGSGLTAMFSITNLSRSESLEEAITASVTAKVSYDGSNPPTWSSGSTTVQIGGSSSGA